MMMELPEFDFSNEQRAGALSSSFPNFRPYIFIFSSRLLNKNADSLLFEAAAAAPVHDVGTIPRKSKCD